MARPFLQVQNGPSSETKWWQELIYIGVLLFAMALIILLIGVGLGALSCGYINNGKLPQGPSPLPADMDNATTTITTLPPEPTASTADLGNATTPLLSLEEEHELQEEQVGTLPRCQVVYKNIKVIDVLYENLKKDPEDALVDEEILTFDIRVPRCEGLCGGFNPCRPLETADEDFVVKYLSRNGTIQYTKRKVVHHKVCKRC